MKIDLWAAKRAHKILCHKQGQTCKTSDIGTHENPLQISNLNMEDLLRQWLRSYPDLTNDIREYPVRKSRSEKSDLQRCQCYTNPS